jgi:D-glycero-D-manno-heptose 1,7-bisphosphate phosphatase
MRVVFLDRDGVINEDRDDYVKNLDELKIFSYTPDAIKKLNDAGFEVHVISNQQGIAKKLISEDDLMAMEREIKRRVEAVGGKISSFSYCRHFAADKCSCRKPNPGMILTKAGERGIDLNESYMIGDSEKDVIAGKRAGCKTILVTSGLFTRDDIARFENQPDYIADNLAQAVDHIVQSVSISS